MKFRNSFLVAIFLSCLILSVSYAQEGSDDEHQMLLSRLTAVEHCVELIAYIDGLLESAASDPTVTKMPPQAVKAETLLADFLHEQSLLASSPRAYSARVEQFSKDTRAIVPRRLPSPVLRIQ